MGLTAKSTGRQLMSDGMIKNPVKNILLHWQVILMWENPQCLTPLPA